MYGNYYNPYGATQQMQQRLANLQQQQQQMYQQPMPTMMPPAQPNAYPPVQQIKGRPVTSIEKLEEQIGGMTNDEHISDDADGAAGRKSNGTNAAVRRTKSANE